MQGRAPQLVPLTAQSYPSIVPWGFEPASQ